MSWLELFFDLVFVAAVAQVAEPLAEHFTLAEVGRFVLLFLLIWWAWLGQTVFATRFSDADRFERALTFLQICAAAAMAVNSQGALDSRDSAGFAAAYGVMRVILAVQYGRVQARAAARGLTDRYFRGCTVSAALWLASAFLEPPARFWLWSAALVVDVLTPVVAETHAAVLPPNSTHLPERFGLFTIILLGEAMAAVMRGMREHETWPVAAALSVLTGLAIVFRVWWWYFHRVGAAAPRRVRSRRQVRLLLAWTYAHLPLYVGIAVLGVGLEHVIVTVAPGPLEPAVVASTALALAAVLGALAVLRWTADGAQEARAGAPY